MTTGKWNNRFTQTKTNEVTQTIYIIAGPNGAGKTTFALQFLPIEGGCLTFINADLIAAGLAPLRPELAAVRAGRLMLEFVNEHAAGGNSFAFETTLAGKGFAKSIPRWRAGGYRVVIYFLSVPTVKHALERVAHRVRQGGHAVPDDVIRRRFVSGLRNFREIYKPLVDGWFLLDNLGKEPRLLESGGLP